MQFPPIGLLLALATALSTGAALVGWRNRDTDGAPVFIGLMTLVAFWSLTYAFELLSTDVAWKLFWNNVQYLPGFLTPLAFCAFALAYAGKADAITPRLAAVLAFPPVATGLAMWMPATEPLVRQEARLVAWGSYTALDVVHGPLFVAALAYSYLFVAVGLLQLVSTSLRAPLVYKQQSALVALGAVVPIGASVASYISGYTIIDLTPVALSAFGVAVAVALARYQLLTVSPVERDAILSEVTDAILVTDRTDRLLDRNPAAAAVLDDAASVGTDLATVDAAPVPTLLAAPCGTTTELTVAGDRTRRFDCRKIALSDDDPDGGARLYVLHDVTERREHERQLERKNERLDRFAGVVSHDLRNPLSIAMGHADLAERDPDPEHFETIADAHDRMDEIIESLLTLARTGNDVADPTPVDLGTVAERAWDQVETDDASLSVDADGLVSADSQRLAQAFENLFRNALEHGGADVDVTVGSSPSGFYVADTGPGIPEADRDTVFDPGVTTDDGGTGVGLAIVSAVAAGHGWTVSAGEGAAGGARFDFATGEPASADATAVTDATATDGGVRRRSPR